MSIRRQLNVREETAKRLAKWGKFQESFDLLINRILDVLESHNIRPDATGRLKKS